MMPTDLQGWLQHLERLHPHSIEMGLDRVIAVRDSMALDALPFPVITVGGTNGKGSCAAFIAAMLEACGHRTGLYTSPHLLAYNERVTVSGTLAGDADLCRAFAAVEAARGDTTLTYFEFGTLAAIRHFVDAGCAAAVLEVGMGGRLDATNAFDPVAAVVVSVGTDHAEWLGTDREAVGREKAGIFRPGRPAVCADPDPPASVIEGARDIGAALVRSGVEYGYRVLGDGRWTFEGARLSLDALPRPSLTGRHQYGNAAAALAVVDAMPGLFDADGAALGHALAGVRLRARFERVGTAPDVIVDVAHNPEAARVLAAELAGSPGRGRTFAVCAMLADKRIEDTLAELDAVVDSWFVAGSDGPRGLDGRAFAARAAGVSRPVVTHTEVGDALDAAMTEAGPDDRIVVFGSFLTAAAALRHLGVGA